MAFWVVWVVGMNGVSEDILVIFDFPALWDLHRNEAVIELFIGDVLGFAGFDNDGWFTVAATANNFAVFVDGLTATTVSEGTDKGAKAKTENNGAEEGDKEGGDKFVVIEESWSCFLLGHKLVPLIFKFNAGTGFE